MEKLTEISWNTLPVVFSLDTWQYFTEYPNFYCHKMAIFEEEVICKHPKIVTLSDVSG